MFANKNKHENHSNATYMMFKELPVENILYRKLMILQTSWEMWK